MNALRNNLIGRISVRGRPGIRARLAGKKREMSAGGGGSNALSSEGSSTGIWSFILFVLLHPLFAYAFRASPALGSVHAVIVLIYGLNQVRKRPDNIKIAQWACYVVGAEVLWRMCKCTMPWEFGKLSILLVISIALFRQKNARFSSIPIAYIGCLIPSSLLTFLELSPDEARQQLSFNLAGPACLAACALWFPNVKGDRSQMVTVCKGIVGPLVGVGFIALFSLATTEADFGSNSNFVGSGGYGPNQVSSMLALGALFVSLMWLLERSSNILKLFFGLLGLWLVVQCALTFSRTGLYLFGGAILGATAFLVQSREMGFKLVVILACLGIGSAVIFPTINRYTDGKLGERFADKNLTGRDTIADLDMQVFRENFILGVGPGISPIARARLGDNHAAHTEYTRLLAEHGILGAFALVLLFVMAIAGLARASGPIERGIVAALCVWSFGFMAGTGMRLAAPSLLMGMIQCGLLRNKEDNHVQGKTLSGGNRMRNKVWAGQIRR